MDIQSIQVDPKTMAPVIQTQNFTVGVLGVNLGRPEIDRVEFQGGDKSLAMMFVKMYMVHCNPEVDDHRIDVGDVMNKMHMLSMI
jgi:hypothetical protein